MAPVETSSEGLHSGIKGRHHKTSDQLQQALKGEEEGPVLITSPSTLPLSNGGVPGSWRIVDSVGLGAQPPKTPRPKLVPENGPSKR